jgi:single-strand DNA-binding protein
MNNWAFTGNLGRDAESRFTASGDLVVSFSVAVKSGFGDKALTSWVNCNLWGKRGEALASYLKKGTLVGITGEASLREWTDKDQQKRVSLDVRVNDLTLLGGKPGGESGDRTAKPRADRPVRDADPDPFDESDLPF